MPAEKLNFSCFTLPADHSHASARTRLPNRQHSSFTTSCRARSLTFFANLLAGRTHATKSHHPETPSHYDKHIAARLADSRLGTLHTAKFGNSALLESFSAVPGKQPFVCPPAIQSSRQDQRSLHACTTRAEHGTRESRPSRDVWDASFCCVKGGVYTLRYILSCRAIITGSSGIRHSLKNRLPTVSPALRSYCTQSYQHYCPATQPATSQTAKTASKSC